MHSLGVPPLISFVGCTGHAGPDPSVMVPLVPPQCWVSIASGPYVFKSNHGLGFVAVTLVTTRCWLKLPYFTAVIKIFTALVSVVTFDIQDNHSGGEFLLTSSGKIILSNSLPI